MPTCAAAASSPYLPYISLYLPCIPARSPLDLRLISPGELAAQLEGKIDVLNNVSNAPPQLFEAAAGMHSGELGGAAVRVREGRPVARAKNASRADLRNVANPMAAGGEAEQAIYGTVYGERTATTDAKNVASERYAFQIPSH